jgi:hypothetical protein
MFPCKTPPKTPPTKRACVSQATVGSFTGGGESQGKLKCFCRKPNHSAKKSHDMPWDGTRHHAAALPDRNVWYKQLCLLQHITPAVNAKRENQQHWTLVKRRFQLLKPPRTKYFGQRTFSSFPHTSNTNRLNSANCLTCFTKCTPNSSTWKWKINEKNPAAFPGSSKSYRLGRNETK